MTILEHLKSRDLEISLYSDIIISEDAVVFPLWTLSGRLVGYQQYKPFQPKKSKTLPLEERRYDTKITRYDGKHVALTAWGLQLLPKSKRTPIFITEGIFDAAKLHKLGLPALAVLTSDTKYLQSWLWSLGYEIIPVCEGDEAGLKLESLSTHSRTIFLEKGYDLGDLSLEKIKVIFKEYL